MNIKNRLYISAGISIVLVVLLFSAVLTTSNRIAEENIKHDLLHNVEKAVVELDMVAYEYLLYSEKRMERQWRSKYVSITKVLEKAAAAAAADEEVRSMRVNYAALGDLFSQLIASHEKRQKLIAEKASREKVDIVFLLEERLASQLLIKSHLLFTSASRLADEAEAKVKGAQRLTTNLTLTLMFVLAMTVLASSLLVARSISRPLDELTRGAERIGKGDLEHKVEVKARDELGKLAVAFNNMTENLKKITASRDELDREVAERKRIADELEKNVEKLNKSQKAMLLMVEDLNKTSKDLKEANVRLLGLDRLKSMFIASMSHELRTPLNSIIGFTGIMLQGLAGELSEEQRKQMGMVKSSAHHLLSLINDVIDVSKIEAEKIQISIEEFDLSQLLSEIKGSFAVAVDEKGLELSLETPKKLMIRSDLRRTKQIIMNLVSNAIKFTEEGGVEIRIVQADGKVNISVRDSGTGIKQEDMHKLFEAFGRIIVEGMPMQEGTGLGLYLSKKIAGILGGGIGAESEFGKGSVFTFTLPIEYKREG